MDVNLLIQAVAKTASAMMVVGIGTYVLFGWSRLMLDIAIASEQGGERDRT